MQPMPIPSDVSSKMVVEASSKDDAIIVMRHTFDAPRDLVWTVFTTPVHVARWFGGRGFSNPVCEMDVRPGGRWRHVMRMPDGAEFPLDHVFVEVTRPSRLVWKNSDYDTRTSGPPACINEITLTDAGRRTEWELVVRFKTFEARDLAVKNGHATVVTEGSAKLAQILEELQRS